MARRNLNELTDTAPITEEQLHALIKSIDLKLLNIWNPDCDPETDFMAGMDYEENGEVGHKLFVSDAVERLLEWRKQLVADLANPGRRQDVGYYLSVFDDPFL